MGVDMDDYDGNGLLDIVVTNYELETNGLYKNLGDGAFLDSRSPAGIAEPSLLFLAFGVDFADLDQDGDLDLVIANGHTNDNSAELLEGSQLPPAQPGLREPGQRQVPGGQGDGHGRRPRQPRPRHRRPRRRWRSGGRHRRLQRTGRGLRKCQRGGPPGGWLQVDFAAPSGNRFGIGARLELEAGGKKQIREARTASSYVSQNALAVHFGLGKSATVDRLTIRRPGKVQVFDGLPANRRLVIE